MKKLMFLFLTALLGSAAALADDSAERRYAVTVTNITSNQTFTPLLVATHRHSVSFFQVGEAASAEIVAIAEAAEAGLPAVRVADGR